MASQVVEAAIESRKAWIPADLPLGDWTRFASNELDAVHQHMVEAFCPHDLATEGGIPPIRFQHNLSLIHI